MNPIENAIKYSTAGGHIKVQSITAGTSRSLSSVIQDRDSKDSIPRSLSAFTGWTARSREMGGTDWFVHRPFNQQSYKSFAHFTSRSKEERGKGKRWNDSRNILPARVVSGGMRRVDRQVGCGQWTSGTRTGSQS